MNGITCTNNGDGTYTFNGTATSEAVFVVQSTMLIAKKYSQKDLWLTGCPGTGSIGTYWLQFWSNIQEPARDFGSGSKVNIIKGTPKDTNVAIIIETGFKATNLIFKPMLTTNLNATYNDFVSYTGDTGRLNADVALLTKNISNCYCHGIDNVHSRKIKISRTSYEQIIFYAICGTLETREYGVVTTNDSGTLFRSSNVTQISIEVSGMDLILQTEYGRGIFLSYLPFTVSAE